MTDYHNPDSCNRCKGLNEFLSGAWEEGTMFEVETKCTICGFKDYWQEGFFESRSEIISNCETYNFDVRSDNDKV